MSEEQSDRLAQDPLDELLGIDPNDPLSKLARALVEQDAGLLDVLVHTRRRSGLRQTDVAARMGVSQSTVSEIESGRLDVRLSTIRRYAMAIGVVVRHGVELVPELQPVDRSEGTDEIGGDPCGELEPGDEALAPSVEAAPELRELEALEEEAELMGGPGPCARCGKDPASGHASIWTAKDGEKWYCHGDEDESPTCYELMGTA